MWDVSSRDQGGDGDARGKEVPAGPLDAAEWVREHLGFEPDRGQTAMLGSASKRGLLNCTRQWGKSTITAAKAVYQAYTERASLTLVVTPSARQSGEFVRKAAGFARLLGMRVKGDGDNETSLEFPNQWRIVGLPGNETTARGFPAMTLLLVDEAARVSDDLYKTIRPGPEGTPTVSSGALWLMSTPFGSRGFFWEAWQRGGPEWERVRVPAYECPRIQRAFLEEERATMGERWFRQEYLCEFVDSVSGVPEGRLPAAR